MVKPGYLTAAFLAMVVVLFCLALSVFAFNDGPGESGGPFENGATPSQVNSSQ